MTPAESVLIKAISACAITVFPDGWMGTADGDLVELTAEEVADVDRIVNEADAEVES